MTFNPKNAIINTVISVFFPDDYYSPHSQRTATTH